MPDKEIHVVIITGMSGAGKTVAMQSFEDLGYFCVDNLPPALLPKFLDLMEATRNSTRRIALVMDLRGREFFDQLFASVGSLSERDNLTAHILFLDAADKKLVQRYKETRRSHPLAPEGLPLDGILQEREMLEEMKGRARHRIDTTNMSPRQLREEITKHFATPDQEVFTVNMMSFGFKHGIPIDADLVFDVRFLPNPHYIDTLQPKTGLSEDVSTYVLKWGETKEFLEKVTDLLKFMIPRFKEEGKSQVVIAIGCTGGKHRSITLAETLATTFEDEYRVQTTHRDIPNGKGL
ncbi:RNase adapter RapZ [Salsuginibacillus kocurii]|uniref:RNase adapter RapZ n=1 Tax=Salsuginibacillus kocurii TaxID=427078 RepID=UPI00037715D9|nr:RNase adapter RapZ [Salsuginibacillus kocurii]